VLGFKLGKGEKRCSPSKKGKKVRTKSHPQSEKKKKELGKKGQKKRE